MTRYATLGYLRDGERILLGKKKYGGAKGKLNGFGGKVDATDPSFTAALIREFKEETNLDIKDPTLKGTLVFPNVEGDQVIHIYEVVEFSGIPEESDEMTVDWYDSSDIDIDNMWPNDKVWFGLMRLPFKFVVRFNGPKINDHETNISIRLINEINEETYKEN